MNKIMEAFFSSQPETSLSLDEFEALADAWDDAVEFVGRIDVALRGVAVLAAIFGASTERVAEMLKPHFELWWREIIDTALKKREIEGMVVDL